MTFEYVVVEYQGPEWARLVASGWATLQVASGRWATMIREAVA